MRNHEGMAATPLFDPTGFEDDSLETILTEQRLALREARSLPRNVPLTPEQIEWTANVDALVTALGVEVELRRKMAAMARDWGFAKEG